MADLEAPENENAIPAEKERPPEVSGKGQADRLSAQHLEAGGVVGIFGEDAQLHDAKIRDVTALIQSELEKRFPTLTFRLRLAIKKSEIHKKLNAVDSRLGTKLFVSTASIQPDGGVLEVLDREGNWRVILVGESKFQGKDIKNIADGSRTPAMEKKGQYIMPAGNAIERVHKNIQELKNFMLGDSHFPYVVFLQGSNFPVSPVNVQWPNGPLVTIAPSDSNVSRIDRVTASNYGMEINKNYCKNLIVEHPFGRLMLQVASIYSQCDPFDPKEMGVILWDTAITSLRVLADDLPDGALDEG